VDSATEDWIVEQMITVNNLIMASFVLFYLIITYSFSISGETSGGNWI
jgi:hypothetical protein